MDMLVARKKFSDWCDTPAGNSGLDVGDTFTNPDDALIGFIGGYEVATLEFRRELESLKQQLDRRINP